MQHSYSIISQIITEKIAQYKHMMKSKVNPGRENVFCSYLTLQHTVTTNYREVNMQCDRSITVICWAVSDGSWLHLISYKFSYDMTAWTTASLIKYMAFAMWFFLPWRRKLFSSHLLCYLRLNGLCYSKLWGTMACKYYILHYQTYWLWKGLICLIF